MQDLRDGAEAPESGYLKSVSPARHTRRAANREWRWTGFKAPGPCRLG